MDGYIDIYVEDEVGRALLHRLGPGEFFGELALLTDGPRVANLALNNVYGRLLIEFNRLAREVNNESVIEGRWTQADLADLIGTQRETVAKIMTELKWRGYVRREMNRLTILKALPRHLCFKRL